MNAWKPALSLLLGAAMISSCNKSKSEEPATEKSTTTTEETTQNETAAGTVALSTPDKALIYVQAALESTAAVSEDISAPKAGTVAISLNEDQSDPACFEGTPKNIDEKVFIMPGDNARVGEVNERAPYYAAGLWYCHLKNVIPNVFSNPSSFACAVGDIPYDGSVVDKEMTLSINGGACFGTLEADVPASVTARVSAVSMTEAESDFDKHLTIVVPAGQVGEEEMKINILLKVTDKSIAFSTWEQREGKKTGTAARLDLDTGTIRYLELEDTQADQSSDETRVRNTRVFLKGTMDTNGKYSSISRMEGLKADLFLRKESNQYSTRFVSMLGNVTDGVKTKNYGAPLTDTMIGTLLPFSSIPDLDNYDWPNGVTTDGVLREEPLPGCFGSPGATCAGNTGIVLTQDNFLKVFLFPKDLFAESPLSINPHDWAQSKAAFLKFEEGQLLDAL